MDLKKTALLLIDLQQESCYGVQGIDEVVQYTAQLLEACRLANIPIIYTRQLNREDGVALSYREPIAGDGKPVSYRQGTDAVEVFPEIMPRPGDIVIDKYRWSGFYQTNLEMVLNDLDVKHLIIGGFVTDGCLMTSVFDGYFRDYQINLVKDICAATNVGAHMASILIMANWVYGIRVYNSAEVIKDIQGTPCTYWQWSTPDELKFTPETMTDVFRKLDGKV